MFVLRIQTRWVALALFSILILSLLAGCGSDDDRNNLRPRVHLTGSPVAGDSVSYRTEISWVGEDPDGRVDHYQYAIDIPGHFMLTDINNPADVGIAWHDTTVTQATFRFTATQPETLLASDGTPSITDRMDPLT